MFRPTLLSAYVRPYYGIYLKFFYDTLEHVIWLSIDCQSWFSVSVDSQWKCFLVSFTSIPLDIRSFTNTSTSAKLELRRYKVWDISLLGHLATIKNYDIPFLNTYPFHLSLLLPENLYIGTTFPPLEICTSFKLLSSLMSGVTFQKYIMKKI